MNILHAIISSRGESHEEKRKQRDSAVGSDNMSEKGGSKCKGPEAGMNSCA